MLGMVKAFEKNTKKSCPKKTNEIRIEDESEIERDQLGPDIYGKV